MCTHLICSLIHKWEGLIIVNTFQLFLHIYKSDGTHWFWLQSRFPYIFIHFNTYMRFYYTFRNPITYTWIEKQLDISPIITDPFFLLLFYFIISICLMFSALHMKLHFDGVTVRSSLDTRVTHTSFSSSTANHWSSLMAQSTNKSDHTGQLPGETLRMSINHVTLEKASVLRWIKLQRWKNMCHPYMSPILLHEYSNKWIKIQINIWCVTLSKLCYINVLTHISKNLDAVFVVY